MTLDNGPSEHLSWKELACKDGTPYPKEYILAGRASALAIVFEDIRALYNKPIQITSAYRTREYNKKIGGARNSQHVEGRALDLKSPKGVPFKTFYNDIRNYAEAFGITGIGRYKTFVHIDIRPSKKLVVWSSK